MLKDKSDKCWREAPGMRQAKEHIIRPNVRLTKVLLSYDRKDLRIIVGILTGHYHLNQHLCRIGVTDNPECRWCLEEDETVSHILCECPALARLRRTHLEGTMVSSEDIEQVQPKRLLKFVRAIGLQ